MEKPVTMEHKMLSTVQESFVGKCLKALLSDACFSESEG